MSGSKTRLAGQVLELEFALECISRGAVVSQPMGDNAHYDLLVDDGSAIHKVQIKKSSIHKNGRGYFVNITRKLPKMRPGDAGGSSRAVAYEDGQIDCIATKAKGVWFFFGTGHLNKDATVYPDAAHDAYVGNHGKHKWEMIGLEADSALRDAVESEVEGDA
jgi:hypothetical protein